MMTSEERTTEYVGLLEENGPNYMGVGWRAEECLGQYSSMRRLLSIGPGASILDIGCGLGFGYNVFHDCSYHGVDVSPVHIGAAKQIFLGSGAKFNHCAIDEEIPLHTYDYILLSGIFNVGYDFHEAAVITTNAHSKSIHGVGVGFQTTRSDGMSTFGTQTWIGLMTKLTNEPAGWAADTTFSKMNAVVVAKKDL